MIRTTSDLVGILLTVAVLALCCLSLLIGWGLGVERLVRATSTSNAMLPATILCLILLSLANFPIRRAARHQMLLLAAALIALCVFKLITAPNLVGLFMFDPPQSDGLSYATMIGILIAAIAPAIRLGVIPLEPDWQLHAPLFGLLMSVLAIFVLTFDPILFDEIQPFTDLSHYTAAALSLIYLSQLLFANTVGDDSEAGAL